MRTNTWEQQRNTKKYSIDFFNLRKTNLLEKQTAQQKRAGGYLKPKPVIIVGQSCLQTWKRKKTNQIQDSPNFKLLMYKTNLLLFWDQVQTQA
jgi:hypothetical protein